MKCSKSHIWRTALIIVIIDIVLFLILIKKNQHDSFGVLSAYMEMGVALLVQFLLGSIGIFPLEIRKYGKGILLGTLIIGLVGLGMLRFSMI